MTMYSVYLSQKPSISEHFVPISVVLGAMIQSVLFINRFIFTYYIFIWCSHTLLWPQRKYAKKLSQRLQARWLSGAFITHRLSLKMQNSLRSNSCILLTREKIFHSALQRFRWESSSDALWDVKAKAFIPSKVDLA